MIKLNKLYTFEILDMKKLILLSALAIIGFTSCQKSDETPAATRVKYTVSCSSCQVTYTNEYGFDKVATVTGNWSLLIPAYGVSIATIEVTESTPSNILSKIEVNGREYAKKFGPQKYSVTVK
jgi:uncharacterized protein (UPF0333 family)